MLIDALYGASQAGVPIELVVKLSSVWSLTSNGFSRMTSVAEAAAATGASLVHVSSLAAAGPASAAAPCREEDVPAPITTPTPAPTPTITAEPMPGTTPSAVPSALHLSTSHQWRMTSRTPSHWLERLSEAICSPAMRLRLIARSASSGKANRPSVTGISGGFQITLDTANHLYVTNYYAGTVGKYDALTGAIINATFVTGLGNPYGVAVSADGRLGSKVT